MSLQTIFGKEILNRNIILGNVYRPTFLPRINYEKQQDKLDEENKHEDSIKHKANLVFKILLNVVVNIWLSRFSIRTLVLYIMQLILYQIQAYILVG